MDCFFRLDDDDGVLEHAPGHKGPWNNIFVSADYLTCDKLMLLVQGSGAVRCVVAFFLLISVFSPYVFFLRAGQWARALCINENLSLGTILPYLTRCKELGYGTCRMLCYIF